MSHDAIGLQTITPVQGGEQRREGRVPSREGVPRRASIPRYLAVPLSAALLTTGCGLTGVAGDSSGVNDYLESVRPEGDTTVFQPLPSAGTRDYLEALVDPSSVAITGEDFTDVSTADRISVGFMVCSYLSNGYSTADFTNEAGDSGVNPQVSYLIAESAGTHLCPEHAGLFHG